MSNVDRRKFLAMMGAPAVAAALPMHLQKALAIPAHNKSGTVKDVEHVVFMMQENRSFDHYFGTLRGVRGFADPHPVTLPSGKSVWNQPNGASDLLPYRPDVKDLGQTFLPDPPHGWTDGHAMWDGGQWDQWVPNKGIQTMTHHVRDDIPYQFALADAFTICDNYHCSVLGPTDPNRYHMWTGWVGNDGKAGGPVITNAEAGYDWSTYPERLERAGISWFVYQDAGLGLDEAGVWGFTDDPYIGNYGDNSLLYFHQYQNAQPGNPLADKAKIGTAIVNKNRSPDALLSDFRADVQNGRLPQVSWIVAPEAYTEHPNWSRTSVPGTSRRSLTSLPRTLRSGAKWSCSSPTTRMAASSTTWCPQRHHRTGRRVCQPCRRRTKSSPVPPVSQLARTGSGFAFPLSSFPRGRGAAGSTRSCSTILR
jgi:phospholipase C